MGEFSLVIFSIAMQAAVGLFFWTGVTKTRKPEVSFKTPALTALVLTAVAMLASLGHLGAPLKAANSILNLGSSWLSREIIFTGAFLVVAAAALHLEYRNGTDGTKKACYWLGTVVGFLGILSMAMIYMQTVIPAWGTWYTLVDFFLTGLILGGILFLVLAKMAKVSVPRISYWILALVLINAALTPSYLISLGTGGEAALASAALIAGKFQGLLLLKWLLVFGGAMLAVLSQGKQKQEQNYLSISLAALTIGFMAGRYIFYAAGVAIGVGMF